MQAAKKLIAKMRENVGSSLLSINFISFKDMIFYSLAPQLRNERGHDLIYHKCLDEALSDLSIKSYFLVSQKCNLELKEHWIKYFSQSRFFDLIRLFRRKESKQRLFFYESYSLKELAFFRIAHFLFGRKSDRIWLMIRHPVRYPFLFKGNVELFTDSDLIQSSRIKLLPIPHCEMKYSVSQKPIFLWPGVPRPTKGWSDIERLLHSEDPCRFHVELKVSKGEVTREIYEKEFLEASVILLPYDPLVYKQSTSGIFVEAVYNGKVPLVKAGSWLAHQLKLHDLEELIVDWENPLFFTDVLKLIGDEKVRAKLKKMENAYRLFHSKEAFRSQVEIALRHTV